MGSESFYLFRSFTGLTGPVRKQIKSGHFIGYINARRFFILFLLFLFSLYTSTPRLFVNLKNPLNNNDNMHKISTVQQLLVFNHIAYKRVTNIEFMPEYAYFQGLIYRSKYLVHFKISLRFLNINFIILIIVNIYP